MWSSAYSWHLILSLFTWFAPPGRQNVFHVNPTEIIICLLYVIIAIVMGAKMWYKIVHKKQIFYLTLAPTFGLTHAWSVLPVSRLCAKLSKAPHSYTVQTLKVFINLPIKLLARKQIAVFPKKSNDSFVNLTHSHTKLNKTLPIWRNSISQHLLL